MKELFSWRWVAVLLLFVISLNGYGQDTSLDNYMGNWSDDATWMDGTAPVSINIADNININGYVTLNGNLSTTDGPNLTFTVNDTLVIRGDFSLGNKTNLVLGPNAILLVDGNYSSGSQVEVGNNGRIIVTGNVTISNSKNTDFDNSGDFYVFDIDGSNFGNNLDEFDCEPGPGCVMDEGDLAMNDPGLSDFFEDVINPNPVPVITTCAADKTLFADATCQVTVPDLTGEVVATDDGTISSITQSPAAGSLIGLGVTTITITVTDDGGKTATCGADILVSDNTAPAFAAAPADVTLECASDVQAMTNLTWTDNCDGTGTETGADVSDGLSNPETITRTWSYTDAAGNTATAAQIITVNDITDPTITAPVDVTVNADAGSCEATGVTLGSPITGDNCGVASVTNDAPATFLVGVTTVTWTVTDNAGYTATAEQTVTVEDNEDPVITGCPADISVTADDEYCGNTVTWSLPTVTDNCSVTLNGTHSSGDFFAVGTTTVTYTAEDNAGNTITCSFNVTVLDAAPPDINGDTNVCTPFTTTYSTASLADKTYQWSVVGGTIVGADSGTEVTVSWTGTVAGTVEVTATSGSGCSVSNIENITKYATPVVGDIVSGSQLTRR